MHAWKCIAALSSVVLLAGCAPKTLLQPDCHSCTVEDQEWKAFSWNGLEGRWRGSVETWKNERDSKKRVKTEKPAELRFVDAESFLAAHGNATCGSLPKGAVVLNGLFWSNGGEGREYEAFVPVEDDKVAYGRIAFEKMNGKELCQFRRYGRVMGKNRLDLPTVSFSDAVLPGGRVLASAENKLPEREINVEFLRFVKPTAAANIGANGRRPASAAEAERPPLMLRVFQVQTVNNKERGEWRSTEEQIYRLWRVQ